MPPAKILVKSERLGRFTIVQITDESTGITGIGISKRGANDVPSDEMGMKIATGRAQKALQKKLDNLPILAEMNALDKSEKRRYNSLKNKLHTLNHYYMG